MIWGSFPIGSPRPSAPGRRHPTLLPPPHPKDSKDQLGPSMVAPTLLSSQIARRLVIHPASTRLPVRSPSLHHRQRSNFSPWSSLHAPTRNITRSPARSSAFKQHLRHCSHRRAMCRQTEIAGGSSNMSQGREVLSSNVQPRHYDLTLEPNFENFTYEGTVVIEYVE